MGKPLRVLFIEDTEDDVWLLRRELQRAGYEPVHTRVDTAAALRQALREAAWDIVISDYAMPQFSMLEALRLVQESGHDLPFIIVSGTVGEETAVSALKAGADDFMTKDRLARFVPGVERALREAATRRERRQHERELQAIASLAQGLRLAETRAQIAPVVLDQVMALLLAESAALALANPATGEIAIEMGLGRAAPFTGLRLPAGQGVSGHVIATGQPYVTSDVTRDGLLPPGEAFSVLPPMAGACVPLIAHQHVLGALWAGRAQSLSPGEVQLLLAMADIAASALHRAMLYEQTQRRLDRLVALRAIDQAINASLDMRVILDVLLAQVVNQLSVDAASVLLANPLTQALEYAAGRGFRTGHGPRMNWRFGEGPAGRAVLERRMIISWGSSGEPASEPASEPAGTAIAAGVPGEHFRAYFAVPLIAKGQVNGVLEVFNRSPVEPDHEWLEFLETLAGQAAIAINNTGLFDGLQRSNSELAHAYEATIEGWSRALDLRDKETEGHTQRVTELTLRLAQAMGVPSSELVQVRRGALLHDIGKMGIPDHILLKPGPLNDQEWAIMRQHPIYAYDLLSPIAYLRPALDIPLYHHEKWDGTGYPHQLQGEQIPLTARIFAVVDVWDALRSDRPYRAAWPVERVRAYLRDQAGRHFDPRVVEAFMRLIAPG